MVATAMTVAGLGKHIGSRASSSPAYPGRRQHAANKAAVPRIVLCPAAAGYVDHGTAPRQQPIVSVSQLHALLDVPFPASPQCLKRGFHAKARQLRPDLNDDAAQKFQAVLLAYHILRSPELCRQLDAHGIASFGPKFQVLRLYVLNAAVGACSVQFPINPVLRCVLGRIRPEQFSTHVCLQRRLESTVALTHSQ